MTDGILGVVLAGGRAARFGADKALAVLGGRTLLERVCERSAPQVDQLMVNRSGCAAGALPVRCALLSDDHPSQGPLAGVLTALSYAATHGYARVATFPCDTPFLPPDLVSRMSAMSEGNNVDLCTARRGCEEHHVFSLWQIECRSALAQAFAGGLRSIKSSVNFVSRRVVDFPLAGDGPGGDAFFNINTIDDLETAEDWLKSRSCARVE